MKIIKIHAAIVGLLLLFYPLAAQSGNGFSNGTTVNHKNTGLKIMISKEAYVVFPEAPNERKQIIPNHELTYEKLKSYGFDPNAAILYALELFKAR